VSLLLVLLCSLAPLGAGAAVYQLGFPRGLELPSGTPFLEVWAGVAAPYLSMALAGRQRDLTILGRWAIVLSRPTSPSAASPPSRSSWPRCRAQPLALLIVQAGALAVGRPGPS
jgi:hypothetical protein